MVIASDLVNQVLKSRDMPEKAGRFPPKNSIEVQVFELLSKLEVRGYDGSMEHHKSMLTEVTVTKMQKQLANSLTDQEMVVHT